jgi:hypothetical protein
MILSAGIAQQPAMTRDVNAHEHHGERKSTAQRSARLGESVPADNFGNCV